MKRPALLLGVIALLAHGAAAAVSVDFVNASRTTRCAEEDNVYVKMVGSGIASFRLWRSNAETHARRFIALVGWLFAILLGLAILLPTMAGLIIPECVT